MASANRVFRCALVQASFRYTEPVHYSQVGGRRLAVTKLLFVGLGGCVGAILRYWMSGWVYGLTRGGFPAGTLVVNSVGSFALGLVIGVIENHIVPSHLQLFLTIGLLGAFTTFSTFSFETFALLEIGSYGRAILNLVASVGVGLFGVVAGLMAGRAI